MSPELRAFLTVISWPTHFTENERVRALVECVGMDAYQAKLASRRNTPGIMREIDAQFRAPVLAALHARGVLSIAPIQLEIDSYPESDAVESIEQFPGANPPRFVVAPRLGEPWSFTSNQVWLVVSGRLRTTDVEIKSTDPGGLKFKSAQSEIFRHMTEGGAYANRKTKVRAVIDLHLRSDHGPRLVRLIGPSTRIGIVGDTNRPSLLDQTNPIDLIEALMPKARIDREFLDFDPPPSLRKKASRLGGDSNIEKLEFVSFYSAWVALIREAMGD